MLQNVALNHWYEFSGNKLMFERHTEVRVKRMLDITILTEVHGSVVVQVAAKHQWWPHFSAPMSVVGTEVDREGHGSRQHFVAMFHHLQVRLNHAAHPTKKTCQ